MSSPKALVDPNFINTAPDLLIVGKESEFSVHRITFLCLSPYFQILFRYDCHQNSDGYYTIDMKDVSQPVLIQILNYALYGRADVDQNNVSQLLIASDKYNIKAIVDICQQFLRQNLDSENCFETYLLAHYYNCEDLKNFTADYILANNLIDENSEESQIELSVETVWDIYKHNSNFKND